MVKKGYILIELLIAIEIFVVVLSFSLDFFINQIHFFSRHSEKLDANINARIAIEFLSDKIRNASNIVITGDTVYVDNKKIYLKNDVLIYDYSSVPIANKISRFSVNFIGKGLYEINVDSFYTSYTVVVRNR